ncbi:tRNA (adenosine(37)-N6)-threonylcarbamoyltransferase complex transferase subunit TsaD [Senegalia massiliensis]|uniref:tRNA N6-adenosine threonylcarbamoyltransferase n=1 Tax=Senegalia massiliensis TaxID=1720316 RepID=A0A845QWM2_9CLOT|nr:tRNA (adenosine(37)-N6)-threonylcarbamoyltransferase complex transferase subunit TsaD [Senegalia massiliensis]NBI07317.1 tRNA (adenosine(37)-N6)-threonylcarbamoyltransferase complex transferase subunit TsaD [Senegalia massiliensis]
MKNVITLGVETSCDETSIAIVKNGREVLTNRISSQIDLHKKFGGVVPEVASRKHIETIDYILDDALNEAKLSLNDIDNIAVTYGPGLVGALLVGLSYAKALSFALDKPLIGVNHIEGHISANYIEYPDLKPPFVCLIVSGGHSHLVYIKDYGKYEILGRTRDDAAGEAFDKIARAMNLGYPGGPIIDDLAKKGNEDAIDFPRSYLEEDSFDFSFSGLKSAVLNYLNSMKQKGEDIVVEDVCASFQNAVIEVLVDKTVKLANMKNSKIIAIAGGVASNSGLRELMKKKAGEYNIEVKYPSRLLCTDNAAMIASAGYYNYINNKYSDLSLNAVPNLKLGD